MPHRFADIQVNSWFIWKRGAFLKVDASHARRFGSCRWLLRRFDALEEVRPVR